LFGDLDDLSFDMFDFGGIDAPASCASPPSIFQEAMDAGGSSASGANAPNPCAPQPVDGSLLVEVPVHKTYGRADNVVHVEPFGKISFYKRYNRFEAVCFEKHSGHRNCRLTKGCFASKDLSNKAMGRPLGLMVAWLTNKLKFASQSEHIKTYAMATLDREQRLEGREYLRSLPGGIELLACERPLRSDEGEPDEPINIP
jgi:hypothetical protein